MIFEEDAKWNWDSNATKQDVLEWGDDGTIDEEESDEEENANGEVEGGTETQTTNAEATEHISTGEALEIAPEVGEALRRQKRQPVWMQDFVSGENMGEEDGEINFALYICNDDPTNFDEAMKEEKWKDAMNQEIQSIERNHTWELVDLPPYAKKIGVKWIFKTKLNEEGKVKNARLDWLRKGTHRQWESTIQKFSHLWLDGTQSGVS